MTILLYVGSDSKTHKLEMNKVLRILSKNHKDFTVNYPLLGHWDGVKEETAEIMIEDSRASVRKSMYQIKTKLHRECIACMIGDDLKYFD